MNPSVINLIYPQMLLELPHCLRETPSALTWPAKPFTLSPRLSSQPPLLLSLSSPVLFTPTRCLCPHRGLALADPSPGMQHWIPWPRLCLLPAGPAPSSSCPQCSPQNHLEVPAHPVQHRKCARRLCSSPWRQVTFPSKSSTVSVPAGLIPYIYHGMGSFVIVSLYPPDFKGLQELGATPLCAGTWVLAGGHTHSISSEVGMGPRLRHCILNGLTHKTV